VNHYYLDGHNMNGNGDNRKRSCINFQSRLYCFRLSDGERVSSLSVHMTNSWADTRTAFGAFAYYLING